MFPADMVEHARLLLGQLQQRDLRLATAESCTGGLIAALMTELPGASAIFDSGFVTYSNQAKAAMLGVPTDLISKFGAVSREVAVAMAQGALRNSRAGMSVSVTGLAGPGGGTPDKPVGLVHIATTLSDGATLSQEFRFGDVGRSAIRLASVRSALRLLEQSLPRR